MIWPRASSKLKIRPWVLLKESPIFYFAREFPAVFFFGVAGFSINVPAMVYFYQQNKKEPRGIAHQKSFYTIYRPDDYPKELHKYCR